MKRIPFILFVLICFIIAQNSYVYGKAIVKTEAVTFITKIDNKEYMLEAVIYRPDDNAKHPLIIMNHGRRGEHPPRDPNLKWEYYDLNISFANQGFIVMTLVRRGYGNSQGPDCEYKDTAVNSGLEAAKDIKSAVDYMRQKVYVNKNKIVIMGHSQGGWASLASSTVKMDGVLGIVNLCGGTNYANDEPDFQSHLAWACGVYGKTALVPTLWIYSENDPHHPPIYVRKMFEAFQSSGGKGKLIIKPPFKENGHFIVFEPSLFINDVLEFFNSIGFKE